MPLKEKVSRVGDQRTPLFGHSTHVRTFALRIGLVLALFTTTIMFGIFLRTRSLVYDAVAEQANSYMDLILATRAWNASHGGMWVPVDANTTTNPFLTKLGVDADTTTVSGQKLTLRNPSAMTEEISRIVSTQDGVTFRMTSLNPVNPAHRPDDWEREVLSGFASDQSTVGSIRADGGERVYRMMRPLITDASCLRCHGSQGYRVGDVRGAISVAVPLTSVDATLNRSAWQLTALWFIVMLATQVGVYLMVYRLALRVDASEDRLREAATTDELTRIANRRAVVARLETELARAKRDGQMLGVVMFDIDFFKRVNDDHGHATGDAVLAEVAHTLASTVREYDLVGRFGGEEFLVVAPEIDAPGLAALAERLRSAVQSEPIACMGTEIRVTVSGGTALSEPDDTAERLVSRADAALYVAKDSGRNIVVAG